MNEPEKGRSHQTADLAPSVLDPRELARSAHQAALALLAEGDSSNTVRSYRTALHYWAAWFALRYGVPIALPLPCPVVVQFIVDHAEHQSAGRLVSELPVQIDRALVAAGQKTALGPPSLSTLLHRISVLSSLHRRGDMPNPCRDPAVRELLSKTRRAYSKRGVVRHKMAALTQDPFEALLATCDDSLRGVRDRALLLVAWASGGRRRSEVTAMAIHDLRKIADRTYLIALRRSKTRQADNGRPDDDKPVVGRAADALEAWLRRSGVDSGPIFRRVRRGDVVAEPLSPAAVRDIVKSRAALAGLSADFSAHSLRSGFVTEAALRNVSIGETMALTGHASVSTVVGYFRSASAVGSRAARLLDDDASDYSPPPTEAER